MMRSRLPLSILAALAAVLAIGGMALAASSKRMVSTKLGPRLCSTVGGGKFVAVPEFPGERIDRRLLTDLAWLEAKYKVFLTDGYSMDSVHSLNGEHPLGLGADIVPNRAAGGTWNDIDRLAAWAEPQQNAPRAPFRWVGYDGDANHGRGHHLHLSWDHSTTKPGVPATTVSTVFCPAAATNTPTPTPPVAPPTGATEPTSGGGGGGGGGQQPSGTSGGGGGATSSPAGGIRGGGRTGSGSGGIAGRLTTAPPVVETAGVDFGDR